MNKYQRDEYLAGYDQAIQDKRALQFDAAEACAHVAIDRNAAYLKGYLDGLDSRDENQ